MVKAAFGRTASTSRKRCRYLSVLVLVLALSGPAPSAVLAQTAASPATVPTFTMADCLQRALDHNPDILKAQHDIERTQGLVISAKATLFPHVDLSGRLEERDDDLLDQGTDPTVQRFRDFWTIQLQVMQSLYSGGANRQRIAIAKLQHEAALIQLQATIDDVLAQVKVAVYAIVVDETELDAENLTIKLLQEEGGRQKDLFDAGRTTRFNVLRTEVSLGNEQAVQSGVETDLIARRLALARLLDFDWRHSESPLETPFHVQAGLDCPPLDKLKVEDFITLALARRPELQVAQRQINIAERQIKIDQAANVPRIDAYVADQEFRDQTLSSFNQSQNGYAFGLLGTWDVFDGFAGRGQEVADTAALASQRISLDALRLQIENEVREAYARLLTAQATVQAQAGNQKTAEESVKLARISAESGYATLLDVLQATLDLTAARTDLIRSRQLYLDALAGLEHAISLRFVDWPNGPSATQAAQSAIPTPATAPALVPAPPPAPAPPHP